MPTWIGKHRFNQTTSAPEIQFTLRDSGKDTFAEYTNAHVGDFLAIVMDKVVLSAPRINSAITEGPGVIEGSLPRMKPAAWRFRCSMVLCRCR